MDAVYFLKHSQFEDFEIRYSLRSICTNLPWIRKVWIFGDRPKFLSHDASMVEHVPHEMLSPILRFPVPITNTFQLLVASSLIPELDPDFLMFSDDFIVLAPLDLPYLSKVRYLEDLDLAPSRGRGLWMDSLWRTYDLLKRLNYPRLNYETHVPTYFRRRWILEAYLDFQDFVTNDRWYGMLGITAILNHAVARNNLAPCSIKEEGSRVGFWGESPEYEVALRECSSKQFLNFDDAAFGPGLQRFLTERFPEPSKFERT